MIKKEGKINSKVLDTLLEIVHNEDVPVEIEVGYKHIERDGTVLYDIMYKYDNKDFKVINEALCRAINLVFDVIDG